MTKEEKKQYKKEWAAKNKESVNLSKRKWYENNKEHLKEYRLKNKEKTKEYQKEYRANQKDGYHRVYLLEDYNYVGVTNNIMNRFSKHKSEHKRDCTNNRILYKSQDRKECEELEDLLHDMGYEGKHWIKNKR